MLSKSTTRSSKSATGAASRWRKAVLGLLVSGALLGLLELGLRAILGPPPPAIRVFAGLRSAKATSWLDHKDGVVSLAFKQEGTGPVQEPFPCKSSRARLFFFGGSSVHGGSSGLRLRQEFPALTGRRLGVQAVNLASPGLDSHSIVALLEELQGCDVSMAVVYAGHNDLGNVRFYKRYGTVSSGLAAHTQAWLGRFQLYAQLSRTVRGVSGERRTPTRDWGDKPPSVTDAQIVSAEAAFSANLDRMVWLTRKMGAELLLLPAVSNLTGEMLDEHCDADSCPAELVARAAELQAKGDDASRAEAGALLKQARDEDHVAVRATARMHAAMKALEGPGVHSVDLEDRLPQWTEADIPDPALFEDSLHFSPRGHIVISELIAPEIARILELPPKGVRGEAGGP